MLMIMQAAPNGPASGGVAAFVNFLMPMVLIFGVFWLVFLRPQQRRVKEHQASIAAVKKGDDVITAGGIRGRVTKIISDDEAEVEIAQGVKVRVIKSTITQVLTTTAKPAND